MILLILNSKIMTDENTQIILDAINGRMDGIDGRLDGMDDRFDKMDKRFDKMDVKMGVMARDISSIKETLVKHDEKFENITFMLVNHDNLLKKLFPDHFQQTV